MATRHYDRILKCGCMLSSDGGGGVMPCYAEYGKDEKAKELCRKSWEEFWKSKDAKKYEEECIERNS